MPPRNWRLRIRDILEATAAIEEYTAGMDLKAFAADRKTIDAVVRNVTVIGEAANAVPAEVASAHPEIPWKVMRDFRNVVVHVYFGVDSQILWDTVRNDLPPLVAPLQAILQGK
jgi:uncharacterized protein with HEPN domain